MIVKKTPDLIIPPAPKLVSVTQKPLKLDVSVLSGVESQDINWFWYPYIPVGALTLLYGQGGIGKSWLTYSIAADVSAGRALPGQKVALSPQRVLLVSAEDDPSYIIKPRMERLGANMENIFVSDTNFMLDPKGIDALETAMKQFSITIVFLDPLVAYLGGKMDINKSNEARAMMGPLASAAQQANCALVVVHHIRKDSKGSMMNRALGSVDFGNSVRSACLIQQSKGGTKMMVHTKHNWSAQGPTLAFSTDNDDFIWEGVYQGGDDDSAPTISSRPRAQAGQFLQDILRDGPVPSVTIFEKAAAYGLPVATVNRAKAGLAHSRKINNVWAWELIAREGLGDALVDINKSGGDSILGTQTPGRVAPPADQEPLLAALGTGPGPLQRASSDDAGPLTPRSMAQPRGNADLPGDFASTIAHARALLARKKNGTA